MQFGVHLLGLGRRATVEDFIAAAKAAEELGYHSVWINDHVVIPHSSPRSTPTLLMANLRSPR